MMDRPLDCSGSSQLAPSAHTHRTESHRATRARGHTESPAIHSQEYQTLHKGASGIFHSFSTFDATPMAACRLVASRGNCIREQTRAQAVFFRSGDEAPRRLLSEQNVRWVSVFHLPGVVLENQLDRH